MRVALVYDRVNKWGGAERTLLALHEAFPDAPLFTAVYDPTGAPWASVFDVRTSFLNAIPFVRKHHEFLPWIMPLVFETFDFTGYDVVVSVTSAEAKGIVTKPETLHVCYCLTPTRYLWSGFDEYMVRPGLGGRVSAWGLKCWAKTLRIWDLEASVRPDRYVAISRLVSDRIHRFYGKKADRIIYPPVDTSFFCPKGNTDEGFYLLVSRLVGYKRADVVVDAFNANGKRLVVVGSGSETQALKQRAKPNITFVPGDLTDEELLRYHRTCRAFVFAGQEDFGLVAAEAQAVGKPVVAYRNSGIAEIVDDGTTGFLFDEQTPESLNNAIWRLERATIDPKACRRKAASFDTSTFVKGFRDYIVEVFAAHKETI